MAVKFRLALLVFVLILAGWLGWKTSRAQTDAPDYFPETGHSIDQVFYDFYYSVDHPEVVYGPPITPAFESPSTQTIVQYFRYARFELDADAPPDLRVKLTPLGSLIYPEKDNRPQPMPANFPACRYYPETGFRVCQEFLEFFSAQGGVAQFGYPISNYVSYGEHRVQYFQRARLEWRPEAPPGEQISLGNLGEEYFELQENPIWRLAPSGGPDHMPQVLLELQAHAFVQQAIMGLQGQQTVYVLVRDQNRLPVAGAEVVITVQAPGQDPVRYQLPATNATGYSQYSFPVGLARPGSTRVTVQATYRMGAAEQVDALPFVRQKPPDVLTDETAITFLSWW